MRCPSPWNLRWLLVMLVVSSCSFPATEVLVVLDTDVPERIISLRASVWRGTDTSRAAETHSWARGGGPDQITFASSFAVVPGNGPNDGIVTLLLEAQLLPATPGGPLATLRRSARFRFTPRTTTSIRLYINAACANHVRPPAQCSDRVAATCTVTRYCEEQTPAATCGDLGGCVAIDVVTQSTDGGVTVDAPGMTVDAPGMTVDAPDVVTTDANTDLGSSDADARRLGPAPVELGTPTNLAAAGSYVLLAKATISNVPGSLITGGHVGVSPAAATSITGFSLILDSTTVFSTSSSVAAPSRVYAADYAAPTPTNLSAAVLGMEEAYLDAAGRSGPDFVDLAGGNIGGMVLTAGLYRWGTAVAITTDVTITGGANDVWIFQIPNAFDVVASRRVILGGAAQARNIFWQVGGQVTIGANAHVEGIILCLRAITLGTTASIHGRALAQTDISINNSVITAP